MDTAQAAALQALKENLKGEEGWEISLTEPEYSPGWDAYTRNYVATKEGRETRVVVFLVGAVQN